MSRLGRGAVWVRGFGGASMAYLNSGTIYLKIYGVTVVTRIDSGWLQMVSYIPGMAQFFFIFLNNKKFHNLAKVPV